MAISPYFPLFNFSYWCQEYVGNDTVSGLISQLRGSLLSWNGESDSKITNDSWQPTTDIQQTRNLRPRTRKR